MLADEGEWTSDIAQYKLVSGKPEQLTLEKEVESRDKLLDQIESKKPITLIISGKGILCKQIKDNQSGDVNRMLAQLLPNANAEEFYLQATAGFLHIARKSLVQDILRFFNEHKLDVIDLSLNGTIIDTDETSSVESFLKECAFQFLVQNKGHSVSRVDQVIQQWRDYLYGLMFKRIGMAFLVFCLIVLLGNFLAFDHYNKQHASLINNAGMYNANKKKIMSLQQELLQKQEVLDRSGLKDETQVSFFLDRMVSAMPEQIKLDRLNVNPQESGLRKSDMHFNKGIVIISGSVNQGSYLNNWMDQLRSFEWIGQVEISDYNHKTQNKRADFELQITLKQGVQ